MSFFQLNPLMRNKSTYVDEIASDEISLTQGEQERI